MGNRHAQQLALRNRLRERRVVVLRFQKNLFATELQRAIPHERARQQPGLGQNLKSIADAQHRPALRREILHGLHDGAEPRDGACAQIIPVAEASRHDDRVRVAERSFLVPRVMRRVAQHVAQDMHRILVAVRSGKLENSKVHLKFKI